MWDEVLIGPVGVIAEVQFLRKQGVYKMVRLPAPNLTEQYPDANEYLFFTRPKIQLVEMIIEAIRWVRNLETCFSRSNLSLLSSTVP